MITEFHLLRPWWLLAFIPLLCLSVFMWKKAQTLTSWAAVCDKPLLEHLLCHTGQKRRFSRILVLGSLFWMIISLSGPSFHRLPVPSYQFIKPRVVLLDLSEAMQAKDLSPNRLSRALFLLQDLFSRHDLAQLGLIAFTREPFVVSPLTDDGQTILSLLPALTPEVVPVGGYDLAAALQEAQHLITQAGYSQGDILVLTAQAPNALAIQEAHDLADKGIRSSIVPMVKQLDFQAAFQDFATASRGLLLPYEANGNFLNNWVDTGNKTKTFMLNKDQAIALWRDEGRWFLIPALLLLLPIFQRNFLSRIR
jgi:Ca-activated chloride channel family protein